MRILDKEFELFISEKEIDLLVSLLAKRIDEEYEGKELIIIAILNGSFVFVSDLIKKLAIDPEIIFLKYRSYLGTDSGDIKVLLELDEDIEDRHVLILEDIVDTGKTIVRIAQDMNEHAPASLRYGTLFLKPNVYQGEVPISYIGREIPNDFVVGYGMDYQGKGRGLRDLYRLKSS